MKQVGIFDAKTHLSSLVDEVEKGGEIVITRHGKPVAKLVRAEKSDDRLSPEQVEKRRQALKELREIGLRLKINATHEQIKAWIEEGRH
jgi:prevent-host-death family protein